MQLVATAFTHEGAIRPLNEDTIAVADWVQSEPMAAPARLERPLVRPLVCLVADGMGGHAAGEASSRAAAEYLVSQAGRATGAEAVTQIVREANAEQFELMRERPQLTGMGTTVAGIVLGPSQVIVFNVGDSRVYRIGDGTLTQLSTDDTPGPKLADGRTARHTSNLITQTLGGGARPAEIEPHVLAEPLRQGARYLIASDGLTDLVEPGEMASLVGEDDRASVAALFEAAMAGGGRDNVSIIIARVAPGGS